jgi:hypothetical protein
MVLCLKTWESRSLPGLQSMISFHVPPRGAFFLFGFILFLVSKRSLMLKTAFLLCLYIPIINILCTSKIYSAVPYEKLRAIEIFPKLGSRCAATLYSFIAGWSSPVARQAHNLKVVSSNLAPATKI